MKDKMILGSPYEITCPIFSYGTLSSTFIWTGPNGIITDDDDERLTVVTSDITSTTPTTTSTSSIQFSYLSEDDEGSYKCDVTVFGYNNNYSTSLSIELTGFTGKLIIDYNRDLILTITKSRGPSLSKQCYIADYCSMVIVILSLQPKCIKHSLG